MFLFICALLQDAINYNFFLVWKKKQRALQSIEEERNLEWLREILNYATQEKTPLLRFELATC